MLKRASLCSKMEEESRNKTSLLSDRAVLYFALLLEISLGFLIIQRIPYTEIDWKAYMQEVEGFLSGERDYYKLEGDTGPLVYPAGFVYIYSILYYLTERGSNILRAQYVFLGLYTCLTCVVYLIYFRIEFFKRYPVFALLLSMSRRIHSLFVLRLFNDCFAMFFFYTSVYLFIHDTWLLGCILFSVAVSVKMNVLLFAPGLLALLIRRFGRKSVFYVAVCGLIQLILGYPFLLYHPLSYLHRSFEFGRKFFYIWSVNWQNVPETIFLSKEFALTLLVLHLIFLIVLSYKKWFHLLKSSRLPIDAETILFVLLSANFVGIVFARSLHYQFYTWYFHSLPFLLFYNVDFKNSLYKNVQSITLRLGVFVAIEAVWNIYPPQSWTSSLLLISHLWILQNILQPISSSTRTHAESPKKTQ